jgi:hypothetical protein
MADQPRTNPTPGEITIMAAGALALIFSFFDFYKSPSTSIGRLSVGGGGVSAWGSGLFPVATLVPLFVVVMAVQVALTRFGHVELPARVVSFTWEQIHLVLGFFATLFAIAWLIKKKSPLDFGIGFWFILIASIAALVGAILLWRERVGSHPDSPTM